MGSSPNLFGFCILILLVCSVNWCESIKCSCKQHERNALLSFQKAHMPNGSPSNRLESWSGDDCCTWEGVGCSNLTCHVVSLDLGVPLYININKVLHPATMNDILTSTLTQLRNLEYLDLSGNNLSRRSDDTPKEFNGKVMMNQLRYLDLSHTGLIGQIPHQLGNLSNLQLLDLSYTQLYDHTGFRWVFELQKLQSLNISDVDLSLLPTNSFREFHRLSTLQELRLSYCQLVQDQYLQFLSNSTFLSTSSLKVLDLSYNILEGQIPHQLGNLSNLQVLDLSYTFLYDHTGFKWVFGLRKLQSLNLTYVDLSLLPTNSILQLHRLSTLQELRLSRCKLPQDQFLRFLSNSTILSTSSLKVLDLGYNYLENPIPHTLSNLSSLQYLGLRGNNFSSTVPSFLGSMISLQNLELTFNKFSNVEGGIFGLIEGLCGLKYLDLSYNNLLESITSRPLNFSTCSKYDLEYLSLDYNHDISGGLEWLGNFSSLKFIDLSSNSFSGNFPESIIKLSLLEYLDLSDNIFFGTIPSTLGQLSSLTTLFLSYNNFTGTIPSTLGQLSSLTTLYLSNNSFTGTIPSTLGQMSSLRNLDLSKNKLIGVLPDHIHHHWSSLNYLNLAYNHLNGTIPISLCNSQHLEFLDMKSNRFSGQIPDCASRNITTSWEVVDLSSNSLSGRVPSFLWELPQIELLNLSNNTLKEELPITIPQSLEILDLGENEFYGQIPSWHLSSHRYHNYSLRILRLRLNRLVGMVPFQMCLFDQLQIIDLANNHLTGPIPKCFGNLSGMRSANENDMPRFGLYTDFMMSSMESINGIKQEYTNNLRFLVNLDLSRNHFSGSIPVQLTKLQGLKGLNVSHNQLTGKIPSQIGQMKSMVSLDLSDNNLQGLIPQSLADLTSLSSLNLSYNKLYGPIPTGSQLSTFIDPSIYAGNMNLCGDMLPKKCSNDHEKKPTKMALDEDHNGNDTFEKLWFPGFVVLGTIIGFWGVIGILNVNQGWRYAYLRLGDEIADWIYARWMVKKLK